jgi:hypothetical protein
VKAITNEKNNRIFAGEFNLLPVPIAALIPVGGAVPNLCAVLHPDFALPQNSGGTFRNGGAVLPKNFAPVQDAVAPFTRDFVALQICFAPLQTGFASPQKPCGALHNRCGNLEMPPNPQFLMI